MKDWGRILVATRLEKQVSPRFFRAWGDLVTHGLRPGDGSYAVAGMVAHKAQNDVVRHFLAGNWDTLLTLDSDADVEPDFVKRFREYRAGYAYDMLQAFYPRRGWPPRAIWMKRNTHGDMVEHVVIDPDTVEDVDVCGTHCCLFRREIFETLLGDHDPAQFEWFYYPRHRQESEDAAFSHEAKAAGFRLGATTAIRAAHICEVTTSWDTYQDYLQMTGSYTLAQRFHELCAAVASFTGETKDDVEAKAASGSANVRAAWAERQPEGGTSERAFYGDKDNGYLYDLLGWNCSPFYERILTPLRVLSGQKVLVVGCGLGTEVEAMVERNHVTVYELPGVLRDFAMRRIGARAHWLYGDTLLQAIDGEDDDGEYDLVVAVDTIEHVHPDELDDVFTAIEIVLNRGGYLYAHNNWSEQDKYPMHHDHSQRFAEWCARMGLVQERENLWRRD